MRKITLFLLPLLCIAFSNAIFAQKKTTAEAERLDVIPVLDGNLSDACWQGVAPLGAFSTSTPVFGRAPEARTEVRLFYTETTLYLSAYCFDPKAEGIRDEFNLRDGQPSGDWFQLSLDTWNDDQLAFDFTVSAGGVQSDARVGNADWDAQWRSAVQRQPDGWTLEMRIPFTALRFAPGKKKHTWGMQCTRYDRSSGETSTWSPQNPLVTDRVRQFGTLNGLSDIRQLKRHGLSLLGATNLNTYPNGSDGNYLRQDLAVDARLGLNASTTLDLTLLPAVSGDLNPSSTFRTYNGSMIPAPRQLEAEESDLFNPDAGFAPAPVIDSRLLEYRRPRRSGESYFNQNTSRALNTLKLSTRTDGNWRFGLSNTLLGPAKVESFYSPDPGTFENKTITLQSVSDYNYLTAQYLLPNNGYITLSNAALFAGQDAHSFIPGLEFAVRDKSNGWQLSGKGRLGLHELGEARTSGAFYDVRLARINRRWSWTIGQRYRDNRYFSTVMPDPLSAYQGFSRSFARVDYREFKPRKKLLNRSAYAGIDMFWAVQPSTRDRLRTNVGYTWLDSHFRNVDIGISVEPFSSGVPYSNGSVRINREVSGLLEGHLFFSTDSRKRSIYTLELLGQRRFNGEEQNLLAAGTGNWFFNRRLSMSGRLLLDGNFQELFLLRNPTQFAFERRDTWRTIGSVQMNVFPIKRLMIFAEGNLNWTRWTNREKVLLQSDGQLVSQQSIPPDGFTDGDFSLGMQFFFASISRLRFRYTIDPYQDLFDSFPASQALHMQVEFIYAMGGEKALR